MIQDVVVTCNSRWVTQAYARKAYSYVYSITPGIHGFDLLATFWRTDLNIGSRGYQIITWQLGGRVISLRL